MSGRCLKKLPALTSKQGGEQRDGHWTETPDEASIEVCESEETVQLFDWCRQWPVQDSLKLRGVHGYPLWRLCSWGIHTFPSWHKADVQWGIEGRPWRAEHALIGKRNKSGCRYRLWLICPRILWKHNWWSPGRPMDCWTALTTSLDIHSAPCEWKRPFSTCLLHGCRSCCRCCWDLI